MTAKNPEAHFPTLLKPPPLDPNMSVIETILELTPLSPIDKDLFTNTRPLWRPAGARGLFGGCVIAQCLAAAYNTVESNFDIHSMHCYFVLAGNSEIPIIYHVERVRSGRSFATRTVQARQLGNVIFTTTMSFVRHNAGGKKLVEHQAEMPYVPGPEDDKLSDMIVGDHGPIISRHIDIHNNDSPYPHSKKTRQWSKAQGRVSEAGGRVAHLAAIAYLSDHFFIGTVSRVHKLWKVPVSRTNHKDVKDDEDVRKSLRNGDSSSETLSSSSTPDSSPTSSRRNSLSKQDGPGTVVDQARQRKEPRPVVSMMVSLDHTIYFHDPQGFRADEWLFTEMESPWAGDGRGLVTQRMFTREGKLIATCIQEGVVRLHQDQAKL